MVITPAPAASPSGSHTPTEQAPQKPEVSVPTAPEPALPPCEPVKCLAEGDHVRKDDTDRALTLYRHGCDNDMMMSCVRLVAWSPDEAERNEALLAACSLGYSPACMAAAAAVSPKSSSQARVLTKKAAALYLTGCESEREEAFLQEDKGRACVRAAEAFMLGEGFEKREAKGVSLLKRACAIDHADGCFRGGKHLTTGLRFRSEREQGIKLYKRGCVLGDAASCNNLGVFYDQDQMFRDRDAALTYFLKACRLDSGLGCYNASLIAKKPSPWKLRKKACRLGHAPACSRG